MAARLAVVSLDEADPAAWPDPIKIDIGDGWVRPEPSVAYRNVNTEIEVRLGACKREGVALLNGRVLYGDGQEPHFLAWSGRGNRDPGCFVTGPFRIPAPPKATRIRIRTTHESAWSPAIYSTVADFNWTPRPTQGERHDPDQSQPAGY